MENKKLKTEEVTVVTAPKTVDENWEKMPADKKEAYCIKRKQDFINNSERWFSWFADQCVMTEEGLKGVKQKKENKEIFGDKIQNKEQYMEECYYFKEMDCNMFNKGVDPLGFITIAMSYFKSISDNIDCFIQKKDAILAHPQFKGIGTALFQDGALNILLKVGGVTLQVLTLGIWGLIKSTYNFVKLAAQIYDFYNALTNRSYLLGKVTAEAILLGQSLLTGTRRKRKNGFSKKSK